MKQSIIVTLRSVAVTAAMIGILVIIKELFPVAFPFAVGMFVFAIMYVIDAGLV